MSKWAIIAGILAVGGIVALAVHSHQKEKALEEETSAFAEDTVNAFSKGWDPHALTSRAEPGLVKAMASKGQSITDLFAVYQKLGALKDAPDCNLKDTSEFGGYITASYTCDAQYEQGPATVLLTLRRGETQEEWKVYYINISSPYFSEAGYQRTK